jgi:transcriptional regulator with XRE-family HTH domain
MEDYPKIGDLLLEHRQRYEQQIRRSVSQKEFAEYIGIDDKLYNHIYTGRRKPSAEVLKKLAVFFDDMRFYDAVGVPRPDDELKYIQASWGRLPKSVRDEMYKAAQTYIDKKVKEGH